MEERLKQPLEYHYKMDNKNRGLALIFNHELFVDPGLGTRRGTQVDCHRLHKTFTALNFDVRITNNPTELEIRSILKKGNFGQRHCKMSLRSQINASVFFLFLWIYCLVSEMDHSDNDCLVVIVLSHGELVPYVDYSSGDESNTILSHDLMSYVHSHNTKYPLQMIWSYFTDEGCPSLKDKPRLFLIQACQGSQTDPGIRLISKKGRTESDGTDISVDSTPLELKRREQSQQRMAQRGMSIDETDGVPYEPIEVKPILPQKDFLIAYASLPGYYSFRNTLNGAWFIQTMCKELDEREDDSDFLRILTLVNQTVAYDFESHSYEAELDLKKQIPCVVSMLTKLILFPKAETHIESGSNVN